jgi:hypothetical protein
VLVRLEQGKPVGLVGELSGEVTGFAGPWRASGDWWRPDGWSVETWHVALSGGAVYQLARTGSGWTVEGVID